jgi:hypothetical protein
MNNPFKTDEVAKARSEAQGLYQIMESQEQLWITYNGFPVVPESLLKKSALESLMEIRELYVKSKNVLQNAET